MRCPRCNHENENPRNLFCGECGKCLDGEGLRKVRIPGFVGVAHSTSPAIDRFLSTGDPTGV